MINIKPNVLNELKKIKTVKKIFFSYPPNFVNMPCISFYEASNIINASADDIEYLSEVEINVDIWGNSSEETSNISIEVNSTMATLKFVRVYSHDLHEPESSTKHKTMKFKYIGG